MIMSYAVTCEGAPVQVEGRLFTGQAFYFRARHRRVTLGIGATVDAAAVDPHTVSMHLEGWEDDRHPLSGLDDPMPLVMMMIRLRAAMLDYADRVARGEIVPSPLLGGAG